MLVLVNMLNAAGSIIPVLVSMMVGPVALESTNDLHAEVYSLCLRHHSCFALRTARMISLALF